jgi:hypothetical protein
LEDIMGKKQIALWCVLGDFVALTAYAVYAEGYFAFMSVGWEFASSGVWGAQIVIDFLIALSVALGFVIADARKRGVAYWPFLLMTLTLGSIGPLAYLIHRERATSAVPQHSDRQPALQHA